MTPRNLIVGCDGTWNEPQQLDDGSPAPTSVVRFLRALKRLPTQRQHYEDGVGSRPWEVLPGGLYGYGLEQRALSAYRMLVNWFADGTFAREDNRIFLTGFSRGAYTARRIAGLLAHSGLPVTTDDTDLGWEIYLQRDLASARTLKREGRFFDVPIEMVGVWDTVKATNDADYHDNDLSPNVVAGYHAMAIDERRQAFANLRWIRDPRALQVWFAGVHSDVGGGYKNTGLADVALNWMVYRGIGHGLRFKKAYLDQHVRPRADARLHESYKGIWTTLGERERRIFKHDFVHTAVSERMAAKPAYRPSNLPDDPNYWPPA